MDFVTILTILAALVTIATGVAAAVTYWQRQRPEQIKTVATVTVAVLVVIIVVAGILSQVPGHGRSTGLGDASNTPTSTRQAGSTTPTATATLLPTATPAPPGTVLFRADQSTGFSSMTMGGPWKIVNGVLINDGTGPGTRCGASGVLMAPIEPTSADLEITLTYQAPSGRNYDELGIVARVTPAQDEVVGYSAMITNGAYVMDIPTCTTLGGDFGTDLNDTATHTLRFDLKGTEFRFYVDGQLAAAASDAKYLTPGQVGIYSQAYIKVTSFEVTQL